MQTLFSPDTLKLLMNISVRYLLFAGSFYVFFYVWRNKRYWYAKIQQRYPDRQHIFREIKYSFITVLIFGLIIMLTVIAGQKGLTLVYAPLNKYGYLYYFVSILLMIVLHDTYFYWTHRLMHWKPLFRWAHKTHHLSVNPTPFAAYAFHPAEAVVEVGIIPLIAFTIPHHASAIVIFGLYSLLLNVTGHLGYELFPKGFASHKLFRWHNTSTHHNMHHRLVKCNYGLYFNFWDRIMHTNHPTYVESYDQVTGQREQGKAIRKAQKKRPIFPISPEEPEQVVPET
ncbi:MAG TPA: sterol desaturase family protein [Mucilaginibacter sp.]|nr:sterol desaturase family protein [Mucilaginibacter sp.]